AEARGRRDAFVSVSAGALARVPRSGRLDSGSCHDALRLPRVWRVCPRWRRQGIYASAYVAAEPGGEPPAFGSMRSIGPERSRPRRLDAVAVACDRGSIKSRGLMSKICASEVHIFDMSDEGTCWYTDEISFGPPSAR